MATQRFSHTQYPINTLVANIEPFRVSRRVFYLTPASGAGVCS